MNESNITELLDVIIEEMEGVVSDNVLTIATELIKRSCGTILSDAKVIGKCIC